MVIFTVIAYLWLEDIRRRTVAQFPDEPPPQLAALRPRFTRSG
jgi:hypothetical protein